MKEHDKDGNGVIDRNEAKTLFQAIVALGGNTEKLTEAEQDAFFNEVDDGKKDAHGKQFIERNELERLIKMILSETMNVADATDAFFCVISTYLQSKFIHPPCFFIYINFNIHHA